MEAERTGLTVTEICRRYGISEKHYPDRPYLAEGRFRLEDRPRRPLQPANQIPADLEVRIVEMRKDHPRWGARGSVRNWLGRGWIRLRCQRFIRCWSATAWSLPDRHVVDRQQRFERRHRMDLWQIDATRVILADNAEVWVVDVIDDHSRYLLAAEAGLAATGDLAWDAFKIAASRYGLPRQVLSDNGLIFTGRLHGTEVAFEVSLKDLGIELINSAPYHPQTLGKLERFHRTIKEWLTDEGPAETLEHLQELLDGFRFHYNRRRPHQGIDDATPAERYGVVAVDPNAVEFPDLDKDHPTGHHADACVRKLGETGNIGWRGKLIHVGTRYATAQVRVIEADHLVHIYHGDALIRALTIDPIQPFTNPRKEGENPHDNEEVSHKIPVHGVTHHPGKDTSAWRLALTGCLTLC